MQSITPTRERWQFSAAVLLPVVLALGITAAAVLSFVVWSTGNIDRHTLERQNEIIHAVMDTQRARLSHELASFAGWDDAVINTRLMFNSNWIDSNLGASMQELFGHNQTLVLDRDGNPLYVRRNGIVTEPRSYADQLGPIRALVARLRALAPTDPGKMPAAPRAVADFAVIEGMPALLGVMTIVSDTGAIGQPPGSEPLLAAVQFLDAADAAQLSREYMFEDGRFSLIRTEDANRAVYPIFNAAGRLVAFFEWDRYRPGLTMLRQTGPALLAAFIVASVLVLLLLRQLRQSSAAVEAGRQQAEYLAAHDRLTGLPNRMSFESHLARTLADRANSYANLALLMLDLDRFKQVNDTLGHQAGDELICAVGRRLRDIVGSGVMIARLGGDEFVILIAGHDHEGAAMALANKIVEAISRPFDLRRFKAHVGASVGIVNTVGRAAEPQELMRKADIALYEAKAGGRNRAVVYEEHMNELLQLQHTIEEELREALQRDDQLSVAFQPLVDQQSRKVVGAEALARWHHPKYGQISPARFISVAENTGLIEALGEFVLREACRLGATAPGRTIAVNISPTQLRNPRFASQVFTILNQTGMQPGDLELEITESILLDDEQVSAQHLRLIRAAGIHIALDDFGTGYSSLSYLKRYPVDRIKIDRSFVNQLAEGHVSVAITQAIVTLAHAMDLQVTAEGVETEGQATILASLGCNILQGFLFSGAVPAEQISAIFADEANRLDLLPPSAAAIPA